MPGRKCGTKGFYVGDTFLAVIAGSDRTY